jgi:DNA-binding beta-propeller fold protein YncE
MRSTHIRRVCVTLAACLALSACAHKADTPANPEGSGQAGTSGSLPTPPVNEVGGTRAVARSGANAALPMGGVAAPPAASGGTVAAPPVPEFAGQPAADGGRVASSDAGAPSSSGLREVLLVGNSVSGSISFLDGHTHKNLGSISVIPDLKDRLNEINGSPTRALTYNAIKGGQVVKHFEPSGGDRYVDDVFVSPDGKTLYASRSNLGDVAAFDLTSASHPLLWHTLVDGSKADHATLSPDGAHLIVSATTVDKADVLDAKTGKIMTTFATGHYPHQNDYSADGKHIYNGSIGTVGTAQAQEAGKGLRQLTVVDASTFKVIKTYMFMHGIRPSVITPDEKFMYSQQSYLNGLIKFDLTTGMIAATLDEPLSAFAKTNYPTFDDYPHDSAHHGLAMSADGMWLCDAGTIDNTVSIVSTSDLKVAKTLDTGLVPYWATTSVDGDFCYVSLSGDNAVSIVDYKAQAEVERIPVGKFPQRSRLGRIGEASVSMLDKAPG